MRLAGLDRGPQRRALAEQVLLADELVERARAHPHRERRLARGTGGARLLRRRGSVSNSVLTSDAPDAVTSAGWRRRRSRPRSALGTEAVELLGELIALDTVNPPGNEERGAGAARRPPRRRRLRVRAARRRAGPARTWSPGSPARPTGRRSACSATSTRSRPTPTSGASTPWAGDVVDGEVRGRGAQDMKGQVAAEVAAAIALARAGWRPARGELKLVADAPTRRRAATSGRRWLCAEHPEKLCAATWSSTRAAATPSSSAASASTRSASARRASTASSCAPAAAPGTPRCPALGDNALLKLAPRARAAQRPAAAGADARGRRLPRRAARRGPRRRRAGRARGGGRAAARRVARSWPPTSPSRCCG